ncbi:hypothetical protein E0H80_13185 [Acinetobacter sp. ANC 4779]|uniref:hypothetical protein n=1 Tax=Acinetobacter Taxon 24C TaxID=2839060 RepID=UPI0007D7FE06|nr:MULTISPECIES: hypothetical protein [Acinetobacter Taxon 24C]OAL77797.1 hypothetical protein AY606_10115 [Acinetobacter sp. SFB]TCB48931.1 hypothetical protein E0H80_13185 [Acinetobacter sp. ANC 4779]
MLDKILNHKVVLFWSIFTLIIASIITTLSSESTLSDSLSITFTIFAGFALFFTAAMWLEDLVREICNP